MPLERNMRTIATVYAVALLALGLCYVIAPQVLFGLAGGSLAEGGARTDFRATYGGVHLALGVLCLLRRRSVSDLHWTFVLLTVVVACVAGVRILGVSIDHGEQALNVAASCAELLSCALTLHCARRLHPLLEMSR